MRDCTPSNPPDKAHSEDGGLAEAKDYLFALAQLLGVDAAKRLLLEEYRARNADGRMKAPGLRVDLWEQPRPKPRPPLNAYILATQEMMEYVSAPGLTLSSAIALAMDYHEDLKPDAREDVVVWQGSRCLAVIQDVWDVGGGRQVTRFDHSPAEDGQAFDAEVRFLGPASPALSFDRTIRLDRETMVALVEGGDGRVIRFVAKEGGAA